MKESVFTLIRKGKLPGYLLYEDKYCFAILTIQPHNPGHILLLPIEQVGSWQDIDDSTLKHLIVVAKRLAQIIKKIYNAPKVALTIEGLDIDHTHLHIFSIYKPGEVDSDFAKEGIASELQEQMQTIKQAIADAGALI